MDSKLKKLLEEKYLLYNSPAFISVDPIAIPHLFSKKEDIEIAGFLTATIAWGNRKSIINNGRRLMQMMDMKPFEFVMDFHESDLEVFNKYVHRTFQPEDCRFFLWSLKNIYQRYGGLESVFAAREDVKEAIFNFRSIFLEVPHSRRSEKHLANPMAGSAAKRINMFLRWMVRKDGRGVDFGIWDYIHTRQLYCPLDVHSGRIARKLGLLKRQQNDWKAVEELSGNLRKYDAEDPVKYDFALFGSGVIG